jgi:DNA invertase Pin-like site-specific DNA recombinase
MGIENLTPKGELQAMRIGYARVSTRDQNLEMQLDALNKAGCQRIFTDKVSGAQVERPGLKEALSHLREADTLVVWKLDRLGRSVKGLVDLVNELETREVHFQSITDGVDTKTPAGRFFFHVMASLAQMERELILERTRAGLEAARCAGRVGGRKRQMTRQQGSGREKAIGKRDAATGGGAQLRRVGPYIISMGAGLFTDVMGCDRGR